MSRLLSLALDASLVTAQGSVDSHEWSTVSFVRPCPLSLRCVLQYVSNLSMCVGRSEHHQPQGNEFTLTVFVCVSSAQSWRTMKMISLPLAPMENSCITTTAARRNVSLTDFCMSRFFTLDEFSLIQLEETVLARHWHYEQFVHFIYSSEPVIWAWSNELCEIYNRKSAYLQWSGVWEVVHFCIICFRGNIWLNWNHFCFCIM